MGGDQMTSTPRRAKGGAARAPWRRVLLTVMVTACGAGADTAAPSRDQVAVVASGADLESANPLVTVHPLARQVQRHALFVTLARYDSALNPLPYFARRWEWSEDRRTLRLSLDPALRWHDGTPTTARDVAFTLDAARDPATGSPRAAELGWLAHARVEDDTTVILSATRPLASLPAILCELPIVPAHLLASVPRESFRRHAFATDPLGNGPFRFTSRRAGERWIFDRNDDFPPAMGGPPRLARLIVAVVDEPTTKFAGLVSGDLDLAGIAPTMASLVQRDPTLEVLSYPVTFSYALVFNPARPPFDDVRVRRAVSGAINRSRLVHVALAGFAAPADGPVPPEHPLAMSRAPDDSGSSGGIVGRRALAPATAAATRTGVEPDLDDAGWTTGPDGMRRRGAQPLRFTLLTVGSGDNALEQLVQADMRRIGIAMEIRQMELGAFLSEARSATKRFDALVTGIPGDVSLAHLAGMFDGAQRGGALDYAGYHDRALDEAFADVTRAAGPDELRGAWGTVQRLLAERMPVAWLYHARGVQGKRRRLQGVRMDLRGELATVTEWHFAQQATPP